MLHEFISELAAGSTGQGRATFIGIGGTLRALQLHCGVIITKCYQQRTRMGASDAAEARVAYGRKEEGGHSHRHSQPAAAVAAGEIASLVVVVRPSVRPPARRH